MYRVRPEPSTRIWPYFEFAVCSVVEAVAAAGAVAPAGALLEAGGVLVDALPLELPHPAASAATAPTPAERAMRRFMVNFFRSDSGRSTAVPDPLSIW